MIKVPIKLSISLSVAEIDFYLAIVSFPICKRGKYKYMTQSFVRVSFEVKNKHIISEIVKIL